MLFALASACAPRFEGGPGLRLVATTFDRLPGWEEDDHAAALAAFRRSCTRFEAAPDSAVGTPAVPLDAADWRGPCSAAAATESGAARTFFETWFRPFRVEAPDGNEGLFTGYFEPELPAARQAGGRFTVPLYRVPEDRVRVDLGLFDRRLTGRSLVGRVAEGRLVPYYSRAEIENGALARRGLELAWLETPVDAFLVHVQGSARLRLESGETMRVGFAGHNGRPYVSVGKLLVEKGILPPGGASWPAIRRWVEAHPDEGRQLLAQNPRYVFFRVIDGPGPIGAQGVVLTPGRSLAVDRRFVPFGTPVWLETTWPGRPQRPLRRLLVAQDAGGAIRGPIRGDLFWGFGEEALALAGRMRSTGRYFLLLPRPAAERLAAR